MVSRMMLTSRGSFDAYLVHYDQKDKPQWAVKMGSDGEDKGRALAVDPADGNVVTFGYFSGTARFGHMRIKSTKNRLDCAHGCAAFVAKFLKDGRALWVRQVGQSSHIGPQVPSRDDSHLVCRPSGLHHVLILLASWSNTVAVAVCRMLRRCPRSISGTRERWNSSRQTRSLSST